MSSTEKPATLDEELASIVAQIASMGEEYRQRGIEFFPRGPDPRCQTYFTKRPVRRATPESVARRTSSSPVQLGEDLAALWNSQGHLGLQDLSRSISALAAALRDAEPEQPPDVSPFVYAMY